MNSSDGIRSAAAAAEPTPSEALFLDWLRRNGAVMNKICWPAITVISPRVVRGYNLIAN